MNAHARIDLKGALDALAAAMDKHHDLEKQRDVLNRRIRQAATEMYDAQAVAAKVLKQQEGTVVHAGRAWKVDRNGFVSCEVIQVNLDAAVHAEHREATDLTLTPAPSEKAA